MSDRGRNADLNVADFGSLYTSVLASCATPEQRTRAEAAKELYDGTGTSVALPPVPKLPPLRGKSAPASGSQAPVPADDTAKEFRLRGTSCLFTYNAPSFCNADSATLWREFLAFLNGLDFVRRWSATLEKSLRSHTANRIHLHCFLEFKEAVDWTTLEMVRFQGSRPDARPTIARGDNQKDVRNQGHFYVFADKVGTVFVATSGWEPWVDYTVKGWWLDELWTQHKLDHQMYLHYAEQVRVGFLGRLRQVQALQDRERVTTLQKKRADVAQLLAPLKNPFRSEVVERLKPWSKHYDKLDDRYSFLVLRGASRSGKSSLAKALGQLLGFGCPFVQTVQSAKAAMATLFLTT